MKRIRSIKIFQVIHFLVNVLICADNKEEPSITTRTNIT